MERSIQIPALPLFLSFPLPHFAPFLLPLPLSYTHTPNSYFSIWTLHYHSWHNCCCINLYIPDVLLNIISRYFCYWSFNKTLLREAGILHENSQSFHNIVSFPIIEAGILEVIPSENFHSVFFFIREYLLLLAPQWITCAPPAFCHSRST